MIKFFITLLVVFGVGAANAAPVDKPYPAPEFAGIATWLNSSPLTMNRLRGKVVLVDFWAYSCINCARTLPYLNDWDKKYRDSGLVIIGVHAPEFDFEKNIDNINAAIKRYGITYPVAVDNDLATWGQFHNRYWPAHYLIDKAGNVVYTHIGEGDYDVTENTIRSLLGVDGTAAVHPGKPSEDASQTPETYLGIARANTYSGTPALATREAQHYAPVDTLPLHHWMLSGDWKIEGERIISASAGSVLTVHFRGKNVFAVLGNTTGPAKVEVMVVGSKTPPRILTIDSNRLYTLLSLQEMQEGTVMIKTLSEGVAFYTVTF